MPLSDISPLSIQSPSINEFSTLLSAIYLILIISQLLGNFPIQATPLSFISRILRTAFHSAIYNKTDYAAAKQSNRHSQNCNPVCRNKPCRLNNSISDCPHHDKHNQANNPVKKTAHKPTGNCTGIIHVSDKAERDTICYGSDNQQYDPFLPRLKRQFERIGYFIKYKTKKFFQFFTPYGTIRSSVPFPLLQAHLSPLIYPRSAQAEQIYKTDA